LPYLLLAGGLWLYHLAHRYVVFAPERPQASLDLNDRHRLRRAYSWTAAATLAQFRPLAGERAERALGERFNSQALTAGWPVRWVRRQAEDSIPEDAALGEAGRIYAGALNLLLDLVAAKVGERLTGRMLQRAYDGLPWEEREIGAQYLFPDVARAGVLDRQFRADRHDYRTLLRRIPLLATMDEGELELLCARMRAEQVAPGRTIIRQGDPGDRFYLIVRGHVEVLVRDERGVTEVVDQLDRGDYFGELALLHDAPRNATCRATLPTELLSLSRLDFDELVRGRFDLHQKVDRSIARVQLLRGIPLFAELDSRQINRLAAQLEAEAYAPGEALITQGEVGDAFYVIESGRVEISVAKEGEEKVINERGPGEYVGEIALLLNVPRTATVRAATAVQALALRRDDFERLVTGNLRVGRILEQDTSRRMMGLQRAA
jgi:CRP-like cAMP-binding protein